MKLKITFSILLFSILFANAQVVFEEQLVIDNTFYMQNPNGVVSADFDGDGDQDVLSSAYFGNRLVWLENLNGIGTEVQLHLISSTIQTPWGVCAADLDGDGDLDAVSTSLSGNNVSWFENTDGNGTFVYKQGMFATLVNKVMAVDMDNDNDLDLVWSSSSDSELRWTKNNDGLGTFGSTVIIDANSTNSPGFFPADINGDGAMDIISGFGSSTGSNGLTWFRNSNNGLGTLSTRILISNQVSYLTSVYAGDLDGDGDMDVVSASSIDNKIAWYENTDGIGTFGTQQILTTNALAAIIVRIADVDGDGDKDVVFGSNDDKKIGWFNNIDGSGTFSEEIIIATHSGDIRDIHFSDVDADGDLDFLAATNTDNNVTLYKNTNGLGSFSSDILTKHVDGGRIVVAEDIDNDGDKDIFAASYWDDKISWFKNLDGQGDFFNSQTVVSLANNGITSVFVGDVDGDGFKDLLATAYLDGTVFWFKNIDGLGNFGPQQSIDTNLYNSSRVYLSDIDNDGDMDVFAIGTSRFAWYENLDGLGSFGPQQTIDNINNFTMFDVDFDDLDGDGDIDISVAGSYGMLRYLNTDGQGTFSSRIILETSEYRAVSTEIADVDGDGDSDLLYMGTIGQTSSNTFIGWSKNLNGLGSFGPIQIITTLVPTPKGLVVADFDNDGDIDIASSSQGNGGVIAWYENTDGQGAFANTQQIISQTSNSPFDIYAADIDNNNKIDIVSISNIDDKISWHKNIGIIDSNSISGSIRFDLLGDGCTETDALMTGILVIATDSATTNATFTQENGQFQLYTTEDGVVTTEVSSQLPTYYAANPPSAQSNFIGLGNSNNIDFCVSPTAVINELSVSVYPTINDPRPGFFTFYRIVYSNRGTTQLSGAITYEFDGTKLSFVSANQTTTSQTSSMVTFDYANLNPFETRTIDLVFSIFPPPTTNINEIITSTVTINPITDDFIPNNNVYSLNQLVIGSYDPNDITCLEGDQVLIEDADEYLHYLIRFQNTGTAEAINVCVDHVLDDKLDWTTMQLESLSHSGRVTINNGSDVSFIFNNINLPDSTNDEPNSHGFITYKIKPKNNVALGDIINASAAIYFDFNPPIITNTAATEFVETLATGDFEVGKVSVYPNPTNGILNIATTSTITEISLYNQLGQLVLSAKDTTSIDASSLRSGVYLLSIKDATGATVIKQISKR
ncbi:T9SS type A sorting domain-containing protein [Flavobacterium dankookense]|uniref:Putative secreted protein (Por secretion system target) n=1 Tax=Flavobacterium dankookense TaxID=706186 RepID=A0A4R6Q9U4_9FLAO|nr:T9SS type A sorting domain-containing protein [Flavobacterium dankookense]TDP59378.1 putative secreted protein (Por secretion system target) [Flavobacterium dankookense]